jgi:hypothetical protein
VGARPPQPHRPRGRRPLHRTGVGELRRSRQLPDAPRPHVGRSGALVRRHPGARPATHGRRAGGVGPGRRARLRLAACDPRRGWRAATRAR